MREIVYMKRSELNGFPATHKCPECGEIYEIEADDEPYCDWWGCTYAEKLDTVVVVEDGEDNGEKSVHQWPDVGAP